MPSATKAGTPNDKSLVDFDDPPVNQVVCGVGFSKLERLSPAYIGLWWAENRKDFPKTRTEPPIMGHSEKDEYPTLGRTILVSQDGTQLIQLQPTRFYYNWLKAEDTHLYPRYSKVYRAFTTWLAKFEQFLSANDIGKIEPAEYALTYVNHIPRGDGWNSLQDVDKVLPDISWRKSRRRKYLAEPTDLNFRYVFAIRDHPGRLIATIQTGIRQADQLPVLRLELAAQAIAADGLPKRNRKSMSEWFSAAREAIVLGFLDLTGELVQQNIWQRRD